jgi:acyl-[acyl-carrier-protein]-phospholipid O-acyltransferase/long-chain-fatty-acid--[acyl-carrier-protein] ligase
LVDGWYNTGDVVTIDEDGFITLVGRANRYAKVGGEMVPFSAIEEALATIVGGGDDGAPRAVVTAVPDEATGERLIVMHTALAVPPADIVKKLVAAGLPRLFVPAPADFHQIEVMPLIGIGKVDLEAINRAAQQAAGGSRRRSGVQPLADPQPAPGA